MEMTAKQEKDAVLILVLMEYTLRDSYASPAQ